MGNQMDRDNKNQQGGQSGQRQQQGGNPGQRQQDQGQPGGGRQQGDNPRRQEQDETASFAGSTKDLRFPASGGLFLLVRGGEGQDGSVIVDAQFRMK
jgi:hypothetical protein